MNEFLFKVIVIGEAGVGKTSVIKRYVHNEFSNKYKYTIGVDFALKHIEWNEDTIVRLQLWDIAGQERFGVMTHVYYKEAIAACVVFDITSPKTLEAVPRWKSDVDQKVHLPNGEPVPTILLANKCDMAHSVSAEVMNKLVKEHGFLGWFETSARANQGIDEAMDVLIEKIITEVNDIGVGAPSSPRKNDTVQLSKAPSQENLKAHSGCCSGASKT